jgi:peroxiredoxin
MSGQVRIGDQAPGFTLRTAGGDPVSLREALAGGPVLLVFLRHLG